MSAFFRLLTLFLGISVTLACLECQPDPIAVSFDILSKNEATYTIVGSVIKKLPSLTWELPWYNKIRLTAGVWTYAKWADEIANETVGFARGC